MSIHKQDIENLLEAFGKTMSKNNLAAVNLVPHMIRALVSYVEHRLGDEPAAPVANTAATAEIAVVAQNPAVQTVANVALSEADKVFAASAIALHLTDHGNATVETDKGNLRVEVEQGLIAKLAEEGIDVAQGVADAIVETVAQEGAQEILAVTAKVVADAAEGETPDQIAADVAEVVVADTVEAVVKASPKKPTGKK